MLQDQWPYVVIHVGIFAMTVERSATNKATNQVHVLGFFCGAVFRKDEMTEGWPKNDRRMTEGKPIWEAQGRFWDFSRVTTVGYLWHALRNLFLYFTVTPMSAALFLQLLRRLFSLLLLLLWLSLPLELTLAQLLLLVLRLLISIPIAIAFKINLTNY